MLYGCSRQTVTRYIDFIRLKWVAYVSMLCEARHECQTICNKHMAAVTVMRLLESLHILN